MEECSVSGRGDILMVAKRMYEKRWAAYMASEIEASYFTNNTLELVEDERRFIRENEFDVVAVGNSRIVVKFGKYCGVFKLPRWAPDKYELYDGVEQNEHEVSVWEMVEEEFPTGNRPRLLPIIGNGCKNGVYWWVQMPEVETGDNVLRQSDAIEVVRESLRPISEHVKISDVRLENVGVYTGKPFLIDYGADPSVAESMCNFIWGINATKD